VSGPTGFAHFGHGIVRGLLQALQTDQARSMGATQYGQTGWRGWARVQNGQTAESSSTSWPQKRHALLYPGIPTVPERGTRCSYLERFRFGSGRTLKPVDAGMDQPEPPRRFCGMGPIPRWEHLPRQADTDPFQEGMWPNAVRFLATEVARGPSHGDGIDEKCDPCAACGGRRSWL